MLMTKILHGRLDGIRNVASNEKKNNVYIVKNMLGQQSLYSTHSPT